MDKKEIKFWMELTEIHNDYELKFIKNMVEVEHLRKRNCEALNETYYMPQFHIKHLEMIEEYENKKGVI